MGNQVVTMKWTFGRTDRVRQTLIKRNNDLMKKQLETRLTPAEQEELGELTDILAQDFDWRPEL